MKKPGVLRESLVLSSFLLLITACDQDHASAKDFLDGDPICDCQDYGISGVRIDPKEANGSEVEAAVHFTNFGKEVNQVFKLRKTGRQWRIADIKSGSIPSLFQSLKQNLAP